MLAAAARARVTHFESALPFGLLGLNASVLLLLEVVGRLGNLDSASNVGEGHGLGDQMLSGFGPCA